MVFSFVGVAFSEEERTAESVPSTEVGRNGDELGREMKTPIGSLETARAQGEGFVSSSPYRSLVSIIGALALTLGFFWGGVWLLKLVAPGRFGGTSRLIEIVDSCPVDRKTKLLAVKWGASLLLVSVSPESATKLAAIVEQDEVEAALNSIKTRKEVGAFPALTRGLKRAGKTSSEER